MQGDNRLGRYFDTTPKNYWICLFFIVVQIVIIAKNIYFGGDNTSFFWFCDFSPTLLAIGVLLIDKQFLKGLVDIGLLPQLAVSVAIIIGFLSETAFIGATRNDFNQGVIFLLVEFVIHILPINVAFFITYKIKPKAESLFYALITLLATFVLTISFTPIARNVDLIYKIDAIPGGLTLPFHTPLWIFYAFVIVVLPTHLIQYLAYKFSKRGSK